MNSQSDFTSLHTHRGYKFENLIFQLLDKIGYKNIENNKIYRNGSYPTDEIDISFHAETGLGIVEAKSYRYSSPPPVGTFIKALEQASRNKINTKADISILAISCPLNAKLVEAASAFKDVKVWDANEIFKKSAQFPDILKDFENFFEVNAPAFTTEENINKILRYESLKREKEVGASIVEKINNIFPGRDQATNFEECCIEALKYLFESDLTAWNVQSSTEDGLHRRDLICRILPKSDFWELMLTDIRARYVIFEFKNYSKEITQKEIITTERYLYPTALRNLAILISPKGCSESANKVIAGAMREHGKLIISLSIKELESLLLGKDNGEDPNVYLFDRVDSFLMELGR